VKYADALDRQLFLGTAQLSSMELFISLVLGEALVDSYITIQQQAFRAHSLRRVTLIMMMPRLFSLDACTQQVGTSWKESNQRLSATT
jgi:hypothetical protein